MDDRRNVTMVYSENKLHKTISLPASITLAKAIELGSKEIFQHLHLQQGVPLDITIDNDCTDVYPDVTDDTLLRDLQTPATIVVWPQSTTPGSPFTPSPVMDALSHKTAELAKARSQLMAVALIEEDRQLKEQQKSRKNPVSPSAPLSDVANESDLVTKTLMSRLMALEERFTTVEESNVELRESNAELRQNNDQLEATLLMTMEAVLGDRPSMNKIRNRVLLDKGRNKLAVICGYQDWSDWKTRFDRDTMINFASSQLQRPTDTISEYWVALGRRSTALRKLVFPNQVRTRGDDAAHASKQRLISDSVLSLKGEQERTDMIAIYCAVYGEEPVQ